MNRHMKRLAVMLMAAAVPLLFAACGDAKKGSAGTAASGTGVAAAGARTCFKCHADNNSPAGLKKPFGDTQTVAANGPGWLNSRHANANSSPIYTDSNWASSCASCHDTNDEGQAILNFYLDTGFDTFGTVNKPIAGCESCHGNGGNHYGVGPLVYNNPASSRCGTCHNANYPHTTLARYKEQLNIYTDYTASAHAASINGKVLASGATAEVTAICSRCHTDEGAKRYMKLYDGFSTSQSTYADAGTALAAISNITGAAAVECKTCHDAHNPGRFLAENGATLTTVTISGAPTVVSTPFANVANGTWSAEFATCNICHQLLKADGTKNTAAYHDPAVNSAAATDGSQIITDTHFATGGNFGGAGTSTNSADMTGYRIDFADSRACANCHNPHQANVTINRQWHASKHGGDFTALGAWAHYNWSNKTTNPSTDRGVCQRCHTATGLAAYLDALKAGATYTPPFTLDVNFKPDLLACNGCHSDNKGTLRDPGAITVTYYGDAQALADFTTTGAAPVTYPDAKGSNICISCHTGRESGSSIKSSTRTFTSGTSFINSHYLTAGGTIFAETGYTYYSSTGTFNYANPSYYRHDKIGLDSTLAPNTGANGPCVGCHMTSTADAAANYGSHRFLPVQKDSAGVLTAITTTVCANCHSGQYSMTATELEHQNTLFQSTLEALKELMASKGFYYSANYPYWYSNAAGTTAATSWGATKAIGQQNMGAAFNYNLLKHDPGAYAHNRYYAKRLIYDSMDWMDDQTLNHSTPGYLNSLAGGVTYKADAIAYLIDSSATATDPLTGSGATQTGGRP
ncbi:MAG: hypothetical protein HZA03_06275 [Nitrospinae bacterium]|nr:hypothetical protein [Nitrospinota bacterium]